MPANTRRGTRSVDTAMSTTRPHEIELHLDRQRPRVRQLELIVPARGLLPVAHEEHAAEHAVAHRFEIERCRPDERDQRGDADTATTSAGTSRRMRRDQNSRRLMRPRRSSWPTSPVVMRNPLSAKNRSTPMKPPGNGRGPQPGGQVPGVVEDHENDREAAQTVELRHVGERHGRGRPAGFRGHGGILETSAVFAATTGRAPRGVRRHRVTGTAGRTSRTHRATDAQSVASSAHDRRRGIARRTRWRSCATSSALERDTGAVRRRDAAVRARDRSATW